MRPPFAPDRRSAIRPEINVTPLVDVVLVLLIIFMVVLPSMQDEGRPIEMVKVLEADAGNSDGPQPVVVTVTADEEIFVDDRPVSKTDLEAALAAELSQNRGRPILLRGDARVPYHAMREVFARIQGAGSTGIRLAVGAQRSWKPSFQHGGRRHGDADR